MEIKKKDLYGLRTAINDCRTLGGADFIFYLVFNNSLIDIELKAIEESKTKLSADAEAFVNKQRELIQSYAKKDENNNFVELTQDDGQKILDFNGANIVEMNQKLKELEDENPEVIVEIKNINDDFEKLLQKPISSDLIMIPRADLPKEISFDQMQGIFSIIEKPEKKKE